MANILLVDPDEVARKALQGILVRGSHRFAAVGNGQDAWDFIARNPCVDLVITELKLPGDGGLGLVRRLKSDRLLRLLPVVVYAQDADRATVKRTLDLRVQNFRMKPFLDEEVYVEIEKVEGNPWRARHFEEEKSFCQLMCITREEMHVMLAKVREATLALPAALQRPFELRDQRLVADALQPVRDQAEAVGAWGVVEMLAQLSEHSSAGRWTEAAADTERLTFVAEMIALWLEPERSYPDFLSAQEVADTRLHVERSRWLAAPGAGLCPVETPDHLKRDIDGLKGCPVIDSAAAGFQMVANGHPSCIKPLMDLVARDPGLTVQMLVASNRAHPPKDDFSHIEDARLAVGQLGELRLQDESRRLVQLDAKVFALEPAFSWAGFWTFQRGVARIAQLICRDLEFYSLEAPARTAGQLHDIGLQLLAHLRPAGFQAILTHSHQNNLPLRACERLFLGCTTPELAAYFAERNGLARRFVNLLRWIDTPAAATEDQHLVAIISLARALCRHNEVGVSGEPPEAQPIPLEETAEWAILREGLYPSFNLHKFELRVHAYCGQLRTELSGHDTGTISDILARSAS